MSCGRKEKGAKFKHFDVHRTSSRTKRKKSFQWKDLAKVPDGGREIFVLNKQMSKIDIK